MTTPVVAVVGSVMTDMTVRVDRMPALGETLEGDSFQLGNGGKGANQAAMTALLGAEVEMVACVGDDPFGATARSNFEELGIGTAAVRELAGSSTGVAPILVEPTGENRIVIVPGANSLMEAADVTEALDRIESPDVVLCQLEIPLDCVEVALRRGGEAGAVTILNPAPFSPALSTEILRLARWVVPNEIEFESLRSECLGGEAKGLPEDVAAMAAFLGTSLAVTWGERGAVLCTSDSGAEPIAVPAPAATVTDTTGAGDAFVGAFAYAIARGALPALAGRLACACATSSVERAGTQISYPRGAELEGLKSMLGREPLGASG